MPPANGHKSSSYFLDEEEQELSLLPRTVHGSGAPPKAFQSSSSCSSNIQSILKNRHTWASVLGFAVGAAVALTALQWTAGTTAKADISSISPSLAAAVADAIAEPVLVCDDAWRLPGYTWYGNTTQDVQYIPYHKMDRLVDVAHVDSLNPESHFRISIDSPPDLLDPGPSLSRMMVTPESRLQYSEELSFLRDKHFVSIASSLDRIATEAFCVQHNATFEVLQHADGHCHFPDLNFTISTYMHFGLHQSDWYRGYDFPENGLTLEDRVNIRFKRLIDEWGTPTMLLFTSSIWDIHYLQYADRKHNENLNAFPDTNYFRVTWEQLKWHRARLLQAVEFLQKTFPESLLMYRTAPIVLPRSEEDEEAISIFEMNQSARALMKQLKIPMFNWSDLIRGMNEHKDLIHYKLDSHANWLYGEMMLSMMKQVVEKTQDSQCWVDK